MAGRAPARGGGDVVTLAIGALALILSLAAGALLSRWYVTPTGRRPGTIQPADALATDLAHCPAEERVRLHAFLTTGGRVCWTCRTYTPHNPLTSTPEVDCG